MSGANEPLVFFDVDTQLDFMRPTGKLPVPEAEQIVPNLARLMNWARENDLPVISTADAHQPDDPEFKIWPPHCVIGTAGQGRIPETLLPSPLVIPSRPGAFKPPPQWVGQFIVEKPTYSPEDNPNFNAVSARAGSAACSGLRRGHGILRPRRHLGATPAGISGGFGDRCGHAHYRGWRR